MRQSNSGYFGGLAVLAVFGFLAYKSSSDPTDTPYRPWVGYAFDKQARAFKFGFDIFQFDYATMDECLQDLNWKTRELESSRDTDSPKCETTGNFACLPSGYQLPGTPNKPVGCAYSSNNFLKAYLINSFMAGKEITHVCEALDPQYTRAKARYQGSLDGFIKSKNANDFVCQRLFKFS